MDYAQKTAYQGPPNAADAARPATELEGSIAEIRDHLLSTLHSARAVASRVLPPAPTGAGTQGPSPVAITYHQKLRELVDLADQLRGIIGELNGRI